MKKQGIRTATAHLKKAERLLLNRHSFAAFMAEFQKGLRGLEAATKEDSTTFYSDAKLKELIGHAKMCVRMKLKKDRGNGMTHHETVTARIERGAETHKWLKYTEKAL